MYQVIVVLGRDVEGVTLLGDELGGMKRHCDLTLQYNENLKGSFKALQ
jgi:hypothetical protein